jgi:hypothetical protein
VCVAKRGTDVIVVGEAISPRPVTAMDVDVKVRDVQIPLRVHGPRVRELGEVISRLCREKIATLG